MPFDKTVYGLSVAVLLAAFDKTVNGLSVVSALMPFGKTVYGLSVGPHTVLLAAFGRVVSALPRLLPFRIHMRPLNKVRRPQPFFR